MILTHGSDPNQVALTFDDGPNGPVTRELINLLRKHNAKATFFVLGKWIPDWVGLMRWAFDDGHEIGNHTMTHTSLPSIDALHSRAEIRGCSDAIHQATGHRPVIFRPPYGSMGDVTERQVDGEGMKTVLWSQLSGDWTAKSPEEIVSKVNLDTDKGEIVLLHDGGPDKLGADRSNTVKAVEMILQKWPNKQYVTVSELTL